MSWSHGVLEDTGCVVISLDVDELNLTVYAQDFGFTDEQMRRLGEHLYEQLEAFCSHEHHTTRPA